MCTIVLTRRADGTPLIGANRNEFLQRPSSPPSLRRIAGRQILAPRDERAGGTWLGVNDSGLFAGLTNRFGPPTYPDRRSRGEVVDLVLGADSIDAALARLDDLAADAFNPFHLLVATREAAGLAIDDGALLTTHRIGSDPLVLTELGLGAADDPRRERLVPRLRKETSSGDLSLNALKEVLSDCTPGGSMAAVCVELKEADYGTKSSTIIRLDAHPEEAVFLHADEAPCRSEYDDYSDSLTRLLPG